MSYRQLARMAPTTTSVHSVFAIDVKTRFEKDVPGRQLVARLSWQKTLKTIRCSTGPFGLSGARLCLATAKMALTIPFAHLHGTVECLSLTIVI
jgi:hypothetical protein